mgnify:FL=1
MRNSLTDLELLSNCCSGQIDPDNDFCGTCHGHCGGVDSEGREFEFQGNVWVYVGIGSMAEKLDKEGEEVLLENA